MSIPTVGERRVPRPALDWSQYEPMTREDRGDPLLTVVIPPDSGRHVRVPRGHIMRLTCVDGPQVADTCVFNADDPTERLWANQTLNREGVYVSTRSRLWGTMPRFRPLATLVADTVAARVPDGTTPHHIVLGAHCNPWMWLLATGRGDHPNCYDQLCDAVRAAGIPTSLVHDNVNFFQRTRIDPESHQYVTEAPAVMPGDYVEFFAELDLVFAISACPMGSGRHRAESGQRDPSTMRAEVFRTSARPTPFAYPTPRPHPAGP